MKQKLEEDQGDSCSRLVGQELVQGRTGTGPKVTTQLAAEWSWDRASDSGVDCPRRCPALHVDGGSAFFLFGMCNLYLCVCVCARMCIDISCVSALHLYSASYNSEKRDSITSVTYSRITIRKSCSHLAQSSHALFQSLQVGLAGSVGFTPRTPGKLAGLFWEECLHPLCSLLSTRSLCLRS